MLINTDRGYSFTSFQDILQDMENEGYDTITITNADCFAHTCQLGGAGKVTKADIQKAIADTDAVFRELDGRK